mgnify:CR=1 FL=1
MLNRINSKKYQKFKYKLGKNFWSLNMQIYFSLNIHYKIFIINMKIIVEKNMEILNFFQFLFICSLSLFLYWIAIVFDCFLKSMWCRFLYGFVGVFRTWFCICIWICIGFVDVGVCFICDDIWIWLCIWDVGVWDD